ncbi:MAG TPA: hypothetical protein VLR47_13780 [Rhodospirillales bacterium]|nr:hypothetical protein [Rhodospirillales bacterium]
MMGERMGSQSNLAATQRALEATLTARATAGSAELPNLECRIASLQDRALATRANDLDDLDVRLRAIRVLVVGMGEPGLLLNLVDAALADVDCLKANE